MAGKSLMTTLVLTIDNRQAKDMLADMEKSLQRTKKELAELQEKMNNPQSWDPGDSIKSLQQQERALKRTIKSYESALGQGISQRRGIDEILSDISHADYNELTSVRTQLTNAAKNLDISTKKYKEITEKLQTTRDEIAKRDIDMRGGMTEGRAKQVMKSLDESSYADIKNATETMKKMQAQLEPGSNKWKTYGKQIADATNYLKKWDDQAKRTQMLQATKGDLGKMSDSDLQQQLRYWDGIVNGVGRTNVAVTQYKKVLDTLRAEQDKRVGRVMTKVEGDDFGGNISEMQQRLKLLQDYRTVIDSTKPDAYVRVDAAIEKLTQKIKESQAGFLSYADAMKQAEGLANGTFKGSISDLDKIKKVLEEYKGTLSTSDTAGLEKVNTMLGNIEQKQKELQTGYMSYAQAMDKAGKVMDGSFEGSIADLEKLQKVLTEYRSSLDVKDTAGLKDVDTRLEAITKKMQELRPGFMSFQDALAKAGEVSAGTFDGTIEDLEKIQKTLKEGMESELSLFNPNDIDQMKQAQEAMENIANKRKELAQLRLSEKAESTLSDVENDIWDGTIKETQEAIKLLQEYRTTLKTTDADGLKRVDDALDKLGVKTKQAEKGFISLDEALKQAGEVQSGTFKGTIEDLQKLKKTLEELRKTKIEIGDKDGLKRVDEALFVVESKLKDTTNEAVTLNDVLNNLDKANFNQLQMAAKALEEELKNMSESADDFAEKSEKLRNVEKRMDELKKKWETHDNVIMKTAKRLMAYVAVYGGFNEIIGKMKEVVNMNLQLSDSLADVQKTTGLQGIELQELGRSLERIDTRTATTELYNLAAAAGQIGLKTQEDVLGFAKAANTISVALNELGAEGSASLMKIATLTGEVNRYGTEDALLKVGSAINELTANSAATAGPIADFISRVGGIASASKMAISEMAALGAAADASGQSIEIAGTSMNKLISALVSNTENIAYSANISVAELQGLIDQGETMQAVIRVLESMKNMDRGSANELMKELGSEGARMNQYVSSMVANLDLLKRQLAISREAFEENVSVINEYNVKQESALGILQRMKNAFLDTFVNSKMTVILKDILEMIAAIPNWLEQHRTVLFAIRLVIAQIIAFKIPFLLSSLLKQLSGVYALMAGPVLNALTSFKKAWMLARFEVYKTERALGASVVAATAATKGFQGFVRVVKTFVTANWMGVLLAAAGAVFAVWKHFSEETDKVAKATAELTQKHTRQIEELHALRAAMDATNTSYAVRAAAMKEINSLYSKYLGYELSELDSYEKKKTALDYINAKLKENQTLEMANRQREVYTEGFNTDAKGNIEALTEALMAVPEIGASRLTEAMGVINKAIKNGAEDANAIIKTVNEHFKTSIDWNIDHAVIEGKFLDAITTDEFEHLEQYLKKYKTLNEQLDGTDKYFNDKKIENAKDSYEKLRAHNEQQRIELIALQNEADKATEEEQVAHLKKLLENQQEYLKTSEQLFELSKAQDYDHLKNSLGSDQMFNIEAVRKNVSEATAIRAEGMNKLKEQQKQLEQLRDQANEDVMKYEAQLAEAQKKENNDAEIQTLSRTLEEKKKLRHDYIQDIDEMESKWQDEWNNLQTKNASQNKLFWLEVVQNTKDAIKEIEAAIEGDPFGKLLNLKSWKGFNEIINPTALKNTNPASIVNVYKKLREDYLKMSGDLKGLNKMFEFEVPMTSLEQAQTQIFSWAEQLRNELRRRGLTTTGMIIDKDPKSMVDNTLNKLKTHFIKRQNEIRQAFINGSISSAEMNRRIAANDEELLKARVELRKRLMNEASYFNQALYPELKDVDIQRIVAAVGTADTEVRDALKEGLAEDENLVTEGAIKIREAIEKELAASNPFTALDTQLQSSLDELSLMTSEFERKNVDKLVELGVKLTRDAAGNVMGLDKETQRNRLEFLMEMAKQSYTIDAEGLRKIGMNHKEHYNWIGNLTEQELQLMLAKLQKYYDDALVAQDNFANRLRKSAKASYDQQGLKLGELGEIQWEIDSHVEKRDALRRKLLSNEAKDMTKEQIKAVQDQIGAYNIAINRAEEDRDKILEKLDREDKSRKAKKERETKDEMEASISALQAYYNEQEAMIRKNALERGASQATLDRELLKNTLKREKDEIELRKKLLGEASEFDPNANKGYKGVITGTEFFGKNKTNEVLAKQAEQIAVWGKALQDGIRNQIAKGEITIQEALKKERDKIEKVLLEDDFNAKVAEEYLESIDTLGLLFNIKFEDMKDMDKELGESRLAYMREWAKESYNLNAQQLQDKIEQEAAFSKWRIGRTAEDYEALLIQLRKFHDDEEEADRKAAERRKKIFDNSEQGRKLQEQSKKNVGDKENDKEMWDRFQDLDLVTEDTTDEAQIGIYQAKIDASRQYIEQIQLEMQAEIERAKANVKAQQATLQALEMMGVATDEQQGRLKQAQAELASIMNQLNMIVAGENENILENQQQITDRYMAIEQRKIQEAKKYTDAIVEFSGQMGEAAFGEVEDRKEAGKQLIKTLLTTLKDWAQVKLTELVMQQMFAQQSTAISGQQVGQELGMTAAKTSADIAAGTASATAKEAGSKGWIGLAIGAAIGAALSALLGLALGAINKSKAEVQSISGTGGRLATGMLTYAEGNYPVLGNDGNVYNAKYEGSGMKTGIYRGGAHFGIFSEKKPEAIIDGDTTQRLIMNHPDIWKAIVTLSKNGRLDSGMGMRTFATGNINDLARQAQDMEASATTDNSAQMAEMQATMAATQQALAQLTQVLAGGIRANINMYGEDGMYKSMKKAEKYAGRVGYK